MLQPAGEGVETSNAVEARHAAQVPLLLRRYVSVMCKPAVRVSVLVAWALCGIGGLAVFIPFTQALQTDVPPASGTPSYAAQEAMGTYFPNAPFVGALYVQSRSGAPFAKFVNHSTCTKLGVNSSMPSATDFALTFFCERSEGLGGGCFTTRDMEAALEEQLVGWSEYLPLPAAAKRALVRKADKEVKTMFASLPAITGCPEAVDASLTKDWAEYASAVSASLAAKLPGCEVALQALPTIPSQAVSKNLTVDVLGLSMTLSLSFTLPSGMLWQLISSQLMADGASTSLFAATVSKEGTAIDPMGAFAVNISDALEAQVDGAPDSIRARTATQPMLKDAILGGITSTMDISTMTMPIALLLLAAMVQNVRLLIVTFINLVACVTTAVLIMRPIGLVMDIASTAPSLMLATALAMSIDYSLFMLTRFHTETAAGKDVPEALSIVLATSGRIVLVSGLTLMLCFLMMNVLPVTLIASMGVTAAATVLTAVTAALTITPALLLTCPSFFSSHRSWGCSLEGCYCCCCVRRAHAREPQLAAVTVDAPAGGEGGTGGQAPCPAASGLVRKSCWPRLARLTRQFALPCLVGLLAAGVPFAFVVMQQFKSSVGLQSLMPGNAAVTHTFKELQNTFGAGASFPITLLVVPRPGAMADEAGRQQWLADSCAALKNIAEVVDTDPDVPPFTAEAFMGVMMVGGACTPVGYGSWSHVGGKYAATQVMVNYAIDPFSANGQEWIQRLRSAVHEHSNVGEWYVSGEGPNQMDLANATFSTFPLMIALMMGVVMIVIGVAFGSVVVTLRAVVCLLWMLTVSFGLAVCIFQDGLLDFLHWSQLETRPTGAMCWFSPCISFSVLVGLGLDYDIFYSERVVEEWEHGYSEHEAASRALAATANIISAAGVIMVIAFSSLLMCDTPALNEIAFLLTVGILIDCFITTKIIIPCVMALLGRFNFLPRKRKREMCLASASIHTADAMDVGLVATRPDS